ncbi:MAG: spore germination protein GerW family protein [Myxococcales bacterium]|nr:spore germination protein GerW family protein [Myxococcales bacterium]MDD9967569.1 spore germination protein GerW family protein [Myxococcales bacterium]
MEEDIIKLLGSSAKELETILTSKTVVGDPIQLDGNTIIPLISVGFGLAVASGGGQQAKQGSGSGSGMACGGGVKPIAVVLSNQDGVRVESIKGSAASAAERIAETIGSVIRKDGDGDESTE